MKKVLNWSSFQSPEQKCRSPRPDYPGSNWEAPSDHLLGSTGRAIWLNPGGALALARQRSVVQAVSRPCLLEEQAALYTLSWDCLRSVVLSLITARSLSPAAFHLRVRRNLLKSLLFLLAVPSDYVHDPRVPIAIAIPTSIKEEGEKGLGNN